jgi:hypothetical protein
MNLYSYGKADFSGNSTFHITEDISEKKFSQAVRVGLVTFIICIQTEISDQHRQMNHVSHAFRELLPHTVLADMLHDYQIQCIGTGQQTNFKHCLKHSEIKTTEREKNHYSI